MNIFMANIRFRLIHVHEYLIYGTLNYSQRVVILETFIIAGRVACSKSIQPSRNVVEQENKLIIHTLTKTLKMTMVSVLR